MSKALYQFLKKEGITDTHSINSLFVSAFILRNNWDPKLCSRLGDIFLPSVTPVLVKALSILDGEGCRYQLEDLIEQFENVVSPADKIVTGAVYTPPYVRRRILNQSFKDKDINFLRKVRIADISCGCGGFLMDAAQMIHLRTGKCYAEIFRDNVFGVDIEEYAIERTKILLCMLAMSEGESGDFVFNLLCRDTLDYVNSDWPVKYSGFDIIVGNPPYVCSRNLSKTTRLKLKGYDVCTSGHPDLYIPFFKIATDMLNDGGRLGLITMNTFIRSVNGRAIRRFFAKNRFPISIVDFRGYQVFDSKTTYTCLFFLTKENGAEGINYAVEDQGTIPESIDYSFVPYTRLENSDGWPLNDNERTRTIESKGIKIKDYCPSRHGIATLSNDTFIFKPVAENDSFYFLEYKAKQFPIEKGICRDIVNPNKLNSIEGIETLLEKVIFPYKILEGRAFVYEPREMTRYFPRAYEYLKEKKEYLIKRDSGDISDYPQWYAFGRTQSLVLPRYKLFFPKFANKALRCVICDSPDLLLYNGLAFVSEDERRLLILKAIIESELFWRYVQTNGKPYASGYFSLSGVDIKHFGIPKFSIDEENELLSLNDKGMIERWLQKHY